MALPKGRGGSTGLGDLTGRTKATQQHAALEEQREAASRLAMASAVAAEEDQSGIFDPQTQQRLNTNEAVIVVDERGVPDPYYDDHPMVGDLFESEPVFSGQEDPVQADQIAAAYEPPRVASAGIPYDAEMVIIRTNWDIPDMTWGMRNGVPNNYTFREGRAYEVPVALAEHLNALGAIRQFVRAGKTRKAS
jgi:hypothetical protein